MCPSTGGFGNLLDIVAHPRGNHSRDLTKLGRITDILPGPRAFLNLQLLFYQKGGSNCDDEKFKDKSQHP